MSTVLRAALVKDFEGLAISYDDMVLEPRPWTAAQSGWAADLLGSAPQGPVLELCSGAGHIGLLAVRGNARELVMVDADPVACAYAQSNARTAGMSERVTVVEARLESALDTAAEFVLILADPPWVPTADTGRFPADPLLAIDGGSDGLHVARACLAVIARHLHADGFAVLQVGTQTQASALADHLAQHESLALAVAEQRPFPGQGLLMLLRRPFSLQSSVADDTEREGRSR